MITNKVGRTSLKVFPCNSEEREQTCPGDARWPMKVFPDSRDFGGTFVDMSSNEFRVDSSPITSSLLSVVCFFKSLDDLGWVSRTVLDRRLCLCCGVL